MPIEALLIMLHELMAKGFWNSQKALINAAGIKCAEEDELIFEYLTNKEANIVLSYGNRVLEELNQDLIKENNNFFILNKKSTFSKCVDLWAESEYNKDKPIRNVYYKDRYPDKSYSLHVKAPKTFSLKVKETDSIVE